MVRGLIDTKGPPMSTDTVETRMFTIFQLVNDWLKFAEAKNLAVLTLSAAACSAVIAFLTSSQIASASLKTALFVSVCLFALSCITSLLSFTPRTSQKKLLDLFVDWGQPSDNDNLYFYGDLGKYRNAVDLARKYQAIFAPDSDANAKLSPAHTQLANQMIVNSRIVVYKLRLFLIAMLLAILAVTIILGTLIFKGMS